MSNEQQNKIPVRKACMKTKLQTGTDIIQMGLGGWPGKN